MSKSKAALTTLLLVALMLSVGNACTSGGKPASQASPGTGGVQQVTKKDNGGGGVSVAMTWLTPDAISKDSEIAAKVGKYDPASYVVVRVAFETHSGNLRNYDFAKSSQISSDVAVPQPATAWEPLNDDSHHLKGLLIFPRLEGTQWVEIALQNVAGVPQRLFRWSPPPD